MLFNCFFFTHNILKLRTTSDVMVYACHSNLSIIDRVVVLIIDHAFDPMMHLGSNTNKEEIKAFKYQVHS